MAERGPRDLRLDLASVIDRLDRRGRRAQAQAAAAWADAAGEHIASRTRATGVREGVLVVAVDSAAWATELTALASHLTEAVNELSPRAPIEGIRFVVSRETARPDAGPADAGKGQGTSASRVTPVPLTDAERAQVEHATQGVTDPELRAAMVRAMVADMEWKRGLRDS